MMQASDILLPFQVVTRLIFTVQDEINGKWEHSRFLQQLPLVSEANPLNIWWVLKQAFLQSLERRLAKLGMFKFLSQGFPNFLSLWTPLESWPKLAAVAKWLLQKTEPSVKYQGVRSFQLFRKKLFLAGAKYFLAGAFSQTWRSLSSGGNYCQSNF